MNRSIYSMTFALAAGVAILAAPAKAETTERTLADLAVKGSIYEGVALTIVGAFLAVVFLFFALTGLATFLPEMMR